MSALGPGAVCCGEREGCEVIDCELAVDAPVVDAPEPLPEILDQEDDVDIEEEDDE